MSFYNEEGFDDFPPAGLDSKFDWDYLIPIFRFTSIQPMDIDCMVERHDRFLVIETKKVGAPIPKGQQYTLSALHRLKCFTLMLIWMDGDKDNNQITEVQICYPNDTQYHKIPFNGEKPMNVVYQRVKEWWKDADNYGKISKI